jgi:glutamyl/glutaminyl-tRNA synthetase
MIERFREMVSAKEDWPVDECEAMIRTYAAEEGMEKLGPIVHPVRLALTGQTVGPGLWELMSALGGARMTRRFAAAQEQFA